MTDTSAPTPGVVAVRPATLDDRRVVAGLRRAWIEELAGSAADSASEDADFETRFDSWLEREQHQRVTWLGLVDGAPVGMVNLLVFTRMPRPGERAPSRWGYLANCFVLAGHRNAGVGSMLLEACTAYADEQDFARVVLSPSERSLSFYERGGFVPATNLMVRQTD